MTEEAFLVPRTLYDKLLRMSRDYDDGVIPRTQIKDNVRLPRRVTITGSIPAGGVGDAVRKDNGFTIKVYNPGSGDATGNAMVYWSAGDEVSADNGDAEPQKGQWEIGTGSSSSSTGLSPNALDCGCDKDCIDGTSNHDCQEDCGCINLRRMIYPPQMTLPPNGAAWTEGSAARSVRYDSACIWYSGVFDGPSCTIGEGEDEETVNDEYRWKVWKVTSPPASSDPESPDYHPCVGMWVAELECTTEEPQCDVIQAIFPKVASPCGNDGADCLCPWQFGQGRFTNIYRPRQCKLCVTPYVTKTVPCGSCTAAQLPDALEVTLPEAIWLTNDTGEPYVDGEDPPTLVETPFPASGKKVKVQYASSGNDVYAEGDLSALVCLMLTNCSPSTDWHSCWTLTSCGHNYAGVIRNAFPFGDDPVDLVVVVIFRSEVRNPGSNGEEEIGSEKATVLIFSTAGDCFNSLEGAQLHRLIYTHYEDGQDYDEDHYIGAEGGIMFPLENNLCTVESYEAYPGQHYSAIWEGAGNDPETTPAADDEIANYGNTEPVTIARTSRVATTSGHPGAACGADTTDPCGTQKCVWEIAAAGDTKFYKVSEDSTCTFECGDCYVTCAETYTNENGAASDHEVGDKFEMDCRLPQEDGSYVSVTFGPAEGDSCSCGEFGPVQACMNESTGEYEISVTLCSIPMFLTLYPDGGQWTVDGGGFGPQTKPTIEGPFLLGGGGGACDSLFMYVSVPS